jgi:hypothetical protein
MKLNHSNVSFVKSALRIAAGAALLVAAIPAAGVLLVAAEILGIVEELV